MPSINVDINADLDDVLRYADHDDLIEYTVTNCAEGDILERLDDDIIKDYAINHCNLVEEEE